MNSIINKSKKIQKKPRESSNAEKNYICGGCKNAYKSYPALYLHIKRKHNGIRPPDTRTTRSVNPAVKEKIHTGRPQKPSHDIDNLNDVESYIEESQNELLGFLGESLGALTTLEAKPKLEEILKFINEVPNDQEGDEWIEKIKQQSKELFSQIKEKSNEDIDIYIDYEEIRNIAPADSLKAITWFIFWLGRYNVKSNFIPDSIIIFSKILKVLANMNLEIQDLDNKLVWNTAMKECEPLMGQFVYFQKNKELIFEFIKKVCHLIGKTFE